MQGTRCPALPGHLFHSVSEYLDASWLDLVPSARLCQNYVLQAATFGLAQLPQSSRRTGMLKLRSRAEVVFDRCARRDDPLLANRS